MKGAFVWAIAAAVAIAAQDGGEWAQRFNELKYGEKQIAVGSISVTYSENVTLKPDGAEFSVTYVTEGNTPNAASNQNIKNMGELKKYMKTFGVSESDIETIDYKNYERTITTSIDSKTPYKTELTVTFNMKAEAFYEAIKLLDQNGVKNLGKDDYNKNYYFTIEGAGASEELSAQNVQNLYEKIRARLDDINAADVDIKKYETKPQKRIDKEVKKYFVFNKIKIKVSDFDHIGKIFTKAQELKMNVNNDLRYSVSEEKRQKVISEHESKLFSKLLEKAERAVGGSGYSIGVPSNLAIVSMDIDYGEYRYGDYDPLVTNSVNSAAQTQKAQDLQLNPPSEYAITIGIRGAFDITRERR
ncbi:MAG: SIMPL domain-containing protein [Helicobacteraceae bacterium]|jgi:uncharacterized protein YggE|nr:SIMPL domain-containing protein [Helicobacteraceae bacterium]